MARRKTPTKVEEPSKAETKEEPSKAETKEEPSKAETKEEPSKAEEPKETPKSKVKKYVSTRAQQWHPFQKVMIPVGGPGAILEMDSWLKCQIEVGLVKEV